MIYVFDIKEDCCGCTACQHICPTKAIKMKPDEEGFLYPEINQELCNDCGLCRKVCAFQNGYDTSDNFSIPKVYAIKNKDEDVRMASSSGGIFSAISDCVLDNDGLVSGVAFDENMNVVHKIATTKEKRDEFRGSKYVQSNLHHLYSEIKNLLKQNKMVLFTGTPCQNAGLKGFLDMARVNKENLILCDIVCHGTPSPLLWKEHIRQLENRGNGKVVQYYCRSKVKGWHGHTELVVYENGKKDYKSLSSQKHKVLFYSHIMLRPSCHYCRYANFKRPSDITIADFWGIEKTLPQFDDNKGISLALINTAKGRKLFEDIKAKITYKESNTKDCLQHNLQKPSKISEKREQFWQDYQLHGYEYVIKKYAGFGLVGELKRATAKMLNKLGLLHIVKRIIGGS